MVNHLDNNIVFLMKFGTKQHIEDLWSKGELFFSPASQFIQKVGNSDGQYDKWDSHQNTHATHLVYAELLYEDEKGPHYGPVKKLADKAIIHTITNRTKKIPMTCFRIVTDEEIDNNHCLIFSEEIIKQIKKEFPEYDTFILMPAEWLLNAIYRNKENYNVMFGKIEYGYGETSEELPEYLKMFNKLDKYSYQKEFRIILPDEQFETGRIVHIPPLKDGSIIGNIDQLKLGDVFGQNTDDLLQNIKNGGIEYDTIKEN